MRACKGAKEGGCVCGGVRGESVPGRGGKEAACVCVRWRWRSGVCVCEGGGAGGLVPRQRRAGREGRARVGFFEMAVAIFGVAVVAAAAGPAGPASRPGREAAARGGVEAARLDGVLQAFKTKID